MFNKKSWIKKIRFLHGRIRIFRILNSFVIYETTVEFIPSVSL